ncbi:MAG TPA: cupin domain-containing protein [Rickettsiales bacterium]|nr:cupin domain-containing protein [Rickettsiales bacterium]
MIEYIKVDFDFADERGSLTQLCHDGWKQINYLSTKAGVFRGGHYHKLNKEAFYVVDGEFVLTTELDGKKEVYNIKKGDFFIVKPNVMHSMDFKKDTTMIALYDFGVEKDGIKDIYNT